MSWCFAYVNNKLAEIYYQKNKSGIRIQGHCYVDRSEFKLKSEQKWIDEDTAKFRFIYRNKKYIRKLQ